MPHRRQGRPANEDIEALNELIMATATAVFLDEGYEGASVEKIAAVAGIGKITIYRRYESKSQLFLSVLETLSRKNTQVLTAFETGGDPMDSLKCRCRLSLDMAATPEGVQIYRMMIDVSKRFPDEVGNAYDKVMAPFETRNQQLLERARASGQIRADVDIVNASRALSGMLTGWSILSALVGQKGLNDAAERAAYFDQAWAIFAKGLS